MRHRQAWAWRHRLWSAVTSGTLIAALITAIPTAAAGSTPSIWSPFPLPKTPSVPVTDVTGGQTVTTKTMRSTAPRSVSWPKAASASVDLVGLAPSARAAAEAAGHPGQQAVSRVHGVPVLVGPAGTLTAGRLPASKAARSAETRAAGSAPSSVRVAVSSHKAARALGVKGLVVSLSANGASRKAGVSVGIDYSSIVDAFGGDYAARLHLVRLPVCALTTPGKARCRKQTPVPASANDLAHHRLVGDVVLPASAPNGESAASQQMVLAATSGASSGAGTYTATSLAPSGSWAVGNTGAFTYSYPITVPPSVGGAAPTVALDYNSASVDGRTSANNSQASWIGDGWDYSPGFIERTYKSCHDDGHSTSFDECWAGDNATLSLGGQSNRLVPTGSGNTWRLQNDDGSIVDKVSGAGNGVHNGTYWRLTTQDGTQYLFGADHLPSANGGKGSDASTHAAWGVPVYGDDSGEPCHASSFDASKCTQGWRWDLDFVIDPHHNITVYHYQTETNHYAAGTNQTLTAYTRGGVLTSISYGQQVSDYLAGAKPAAQVLFTTGQRCDPTGGFDCSAAISSSNASHWPDVPYDQHCGSSGSCSNYAPSFWSQLALTTITTRVWDMSLSTPGWSTVDKYTLTHTYPDPGDLGQGGVYHAGKAMWLASIQHTGADTRGGGSQVSLDKATFDGATALPNRVDGIENPSDVPPINRFRLISLTTEAGASITVTYDTSSATGCTRSSPPTEDNDTRRCYPVKWTPAGYTDPILDWFYTYPVIKVDRNDNGAVWGASQSPAQVTKYQYSGAAWHRDDSTFTPSKTRTWGQFRGYHKVTTRTGAAPDPITQSTSLYLQGMNGDVRKDGSKRSVSYTDAVGDTLTDSKALAGFAYQTTTYSGDGGWSDLGSVDRGSKLPVHLEVVGWDRVGVGSLPSTRLKRWRW